MRPSYLLRLHFNHLTLSTIGGLSYISFFGTISSMKKTKRPVILLEVLLAIAFVSICSTAVFSTPAKVYQKQIKAIKELELARASQTLFVKLLPELRQKHKWEEITRKKETFFPIREEVLISYSPYMSSKMEAAYRMKERRKKEGDADTFYSLFEIEIFFKDASDDRSFEKAHKDKKYKPYHYTYFVFASKSPEKKYL